jgi:hypothetical protein|tara:strand:+ start:761 stop:1099 length:339 start_codon:yes stop_codon:yes gene_type:complete
MTTTTKTYHSAGELIADAIRPIAQKYREHVNDIAREALTIDDEDVRDEFVHESVDGSEWVIYYFNARAVLLVTDNLESAQDWGAELSHGAVETTLAFYAMHQDVLDAIERLA